MISRHAFGSRLRTQRERRGVTLESIADSTKIKLSLLQSLERGDASQWPHGLYRRAYIRDYASAIGVPVEPLVVEFGKMFPEDGSLASEEAVAGAAEPLRLTFAAESHPRIDRAASRAAAALGELALVGAIGGGVSLATGWPLLTACGAAALVFYPLATAVTGRVLSVAQLRRLVGARSLGGGAAADAVPEPAPLYLVSRQPAAGPQLAVAVGADDFSQPRTAVR